MHRFTEDLNIRLGSDNHILCLKVSITFLHEWAWYILFKPTHIDDSSFCSITALSSYITIFFTYIKISPLNGITWCSRYLMDSFLLLHRCLKWSVLSILQLQIIGDECKYSILFSILKFLPHNVSRTLTWGPRMVSMYLTLGIL